MTTEEKETQSATFLLGPSSVHPAAPCPICPADASPRKATNRFAPSGLPRPVQGSHPAAALYPPLLPMEMSFRAAITPCEYNRGLRKPTD